MRKELLSEREKISKLKVIRNRLHSRIKHLSEQYINDIDSTDTLLDISDHAIVRFLERSKNQEINLFGHNDTEKMINYISDYDMDYDKLIEDILPRDEMEKAITMGATIYKYKDLKYVIKNFNVVTIMNLDEN